MNLAKMGVGALNAAQYKLQTAAHNVNNAAVEGYNRQTVLTQTAGAQSMGAGYIGRGVEVVTVSRSYDNFLFKQLVSALGQGAAQKSFANEINQVDTLFADRSVGISPAIENFFKSVNAVASAPADPAAREEMLGQANNLASQIRETDAFLSKQRGNINTQITTVVAQINSYVERIRDANTEIVKARASTSQHEPNDLLDQRDQLLKEMNELVGVTVFEQDGRFNLAIGNGQLVLAGDTAFPLRAQPAADDPKRTVVAFTARDASGALVGVELDESRIRGGQLGGLIQYRQEILDDVQNNLGRMAVGLAQVFNEVHRSGEDLAGGTGKDFFKVGEPHTVPSVANTANALAVTARIEDAGALTAEDYRVTVRYDSTGSNFLGYSVTNLTTKQVHAVDVPAGGVTQEVIDGVEFTFQGNGAALDADDSWYVQPTRNMAASFEVALTDPAQIAAAAPGTGVANGDTALKLAKLQVEKTLGNGSMSVTEAFSQMVNTIGVASQKNKTAMKAQESIIQQNYAAQQQISGVNLNEEYMKIEEALEQYRAASRLVEVSSVMFDTLLNMSR